VSAPTVSLLAGRDRRARAGSPWVYSNEIEMTAATRALAPGALVALLAADQTPFATGYFNPHSLIAARILSRTPDRAIDQGFFETALGRALALRARLYPRPFYRLIHSEGDGLPGLVIDRHGETVVCQITTAGMDRLTEPMLSALDRLIEPGTVILRNDGRARALEGLDSHVRLARGAQPVACEIEENGLAFVVDPIGGQKTGWFYDQRENRAFMAGLCSGLTVLDLYCYGGGFALPAAAGGATRVVAVDRSESALALAAQSAGRNGLDQRCQFIRAEAFTELEHRIGAGERFDVVICDPPAFVKSRKDVAVGARGYRKLAHLAASVVAPGGFLFMASCSHNLELERFARELKTGIARAGREGRILRSSGAGPDHPVHPDLPESAYLKAMVVQLD